MELPEIKITSEYLNIVLADITKFKIYTPEDQDITKNWLTEPIDEWYYGSIKTDTNGRQLKFIFYNDFESNEIILNAGNLNINYYEGDNNLPCKIKIKTNKGTVNISSFYKYTNVILTCGETRYLNNGWDPSKGIDPTKDWSKWSYNLYCNKNLESVRNLPLCEIMRDQKLFNGFGMYTISTVLWYLDDNPFQTLYYLLTKDNEKTKLFLELCRDIPYKAYELGGRQTRLWQNPFVVNKKYFNNWVYCSGVLIRTKKYKFYFDPKWIAYAPYELNKKLIKKLNRSRNLRYDALQKR